MLIDRKSTNHHADYLDVTQHWSPTSEKYAGGDSLVTMLDRGWELHGEAVCEEKRYAESRSITIYHIRLERNGEKIIMPVVQNPYVNKVLRSHNVRFVESATVD